MSHSQRENSTYSDCIKLHLRIDKTLSNLFFRILSRLKTFAWFSYSIAVVKENLTLVSSAISKETDL